MLGTGMEAEGRLRVPGVPALSPWPEAGRPPSCPGGTHHTSPPSKGRKTADPKGTSQNGKGPANGAEIGEGGVLRGPHCCIIGDLVQEGW